MSTPQWHEDWFPELRDARPWLMEEMIDSEPAAAKAIVGISGLKKIAAAVKKAHAAGGPAR